VKGCQGTALLGTEQRILIPLLDRDQHWGPGQRDFTCTINPKITAVDNGRQKQRRTAWGIQGGRRHRAISEVAAYMVDPSVTLGNPWRPLVIRPWSVISFVTPLFKSGEDEA
jgi:hypothetical protein